MKYSPTKIKNVKRLKNKDLSRILIQGIVLSKSNKSFIVSDNTGEIVCVVKQPKISLNEVLNMIVIGQQVKCFGQIWLFNEEEELRYELEVSDIELLV